MSICLDHIKDSLQMGSEMCCIWSSFSSCGVVLQFRTTGVDMGRGSDD